MGKFPYPCASVSSSKSRDNDTDRVMWYPVLTSVIPQQQKFLNKTLAIRIKNTEKIIHCDQLGFIPGMQDWFNIFNDYRTAHG